LEISPVRKAAADVLDREERFSPLLTKEGRKEGKAWGANLNCMR
jgi:hypothetical protein